MENRLKMGTPIWRAKTDRSFRIYFWIISYIRPYLSSLLLLILSGLIVVGIELLIPKLIQVFVNKVVPNQDVTLFAWMLVGLSIALAIMFGFMALRNRLERIISEKAASVLQQDIFDQLRKLGFSYFERNAVGESLYLFNNDVSKIQDIFRRYLPETIWKSLFVLFSILFMAFINFTLTVVMLASFCLYYVLGPYLEKRTEAVVKEGDKLNKGVDKRIYDILSGLGEVRAYGSESWAYNDYTHRMKLKARNAVLFWMVWSSREAYRRLTYNIGAVAVFIYGAHLIQNGNLTIGEFIAFTLYYFNGLLMLTNIVTDLTEQRALLVNARRLYEFKHLIPDVDEPENPIRLEEVKGEIVFDHVRFAYPSGPHVLNNFNVKIRAGERVAFVGTSGNGKSTILKMVGRFYDPQEGEIRLDGVPINRVSLSQLRGELAYVFQETFLFGTSVKENIRFGRPDASDEEIMTAAKAACAHDFILQLPQQYETLVGERGVRLSGGQKQRIAIARMFLKNPKVVILDEATSALDQNTEWQVQQALGTLLKGRTTIAVAHRLSTIMDFDRIIVMDDGAAAEQGTFEELVARKGLFYRLLEGEAASTEGEDQP